MAERMLTAALDAEGLGGDVSVDSAGTTGYEAGRPIDPRAARRLAAGKLSSDGHIARQWQSNWFSERDLILALDIDHYAWLGESAPDQESMAKIRLLRSFDPAVSGKDPLDQGIEDPWYGGQSDFDAVWQQIHGALPGIIEYVRSALLQQTALHQTAQPMETAQRQPQNQQQVRSIP
jgi:protein-tyrosine phosphatase